MPPNIGYTGGGLGGGLGLQQALMQQQAMDRVQGGVGSDPGSQYPGVGGNVRPGRRLKDMLINDANALTNDPMSLGMSDEEMQQQRAAIVADDAARRVSMAQELQLAALANPQMQGAVTAGISDLADDTQAEAGAAKAVMDANLRQIEQRRQEILARLSEQRQIADQQRVRAGKLAQQIIGSIGTAAGGVFGGGPGVSSGGLASGLQAFGGMGGTSG